jgi:uncharacterized membrane protein YkvA (DUF1232 family)
MSTKAVKVKETTSAEPKGRRERGEMKARMRGFLMFLPNLVLLLGRMLKDARVPTAEKALFLAAIVYVVSPIDLIPDVFPFIGQVDDLYVVALTLLRLINRSDDTIVRQHWSGGGDIVALADSIASIAPKLLPQRVSRVITSRIELAPAGKALSSITSNDEPLVREIVSDDDLTIDTRSGTVN